MALNGRVTEPPRTAMHRWGCSRSSTTDVTWRAAALDMSSRLQASPAPVRRCRTTTTQASATLQPAGGPFLSRGLERERAQPTLGGPLTTERSESGGGRSEGTAGRLLGRRTADSLAQGLRRQRVQGQGPDHHGWCLIVSCHSQPHTSNSWWLQAGGWRPSWCQVRSCGLCAVPVAVPLVSGCASAVALAASACGLMRNAQMAYLS